MVQEFEPLYKRGRNTILEWKAKIELRDKKVNIFMAYGVFEGKQTVRYQNDIKGKNKGKANETNSWEQAVLEVESKIRLKEREGYKSLEDLKSDNYDRFLNTKNLFTFLDESLPEYNTDVNGNEIPMKCQQYYRSKKDWTAPDGTVWDDRKYYYLLNPSAVKKDDVIITRFPCYIQPKVNGVRAFVKLVGNDVRIYSKKGLEYNIPHIKMWFLARKSLFEIHSEEVIFDGELYIPGESLQNIASAVKSYQLSTMNVEYHMFDIAIPNVPQSERFEILYSEQVKSIVNSTLTAPVKLVRTRKVGTDTRVQELTDDYIKEGYEGSICRDFEGFYEFGKRPKTITKLKRLMDNEYIILDIIPHEKDNTLGKFVCQTEGGAEFIVNPKGSTMYKRELLINRSSFIGKQLTCSFYEYTDGDIPFHIVDNIVRDYE